MSVQILVTKPKVLSVADKASLRKAGVVVVEAQNVADVRFLEVEKPPLDSNDMFRAAMLAIAADKYSGNTSEAFVKNLAAMVKANKPEPPQ